MSNGVVGLYPLRVAFCAEPRTAAVRGRVSFTARGAARQGEVSDGAQD